MFIASDEIVSAIHLQIQYDTADEHVYCYSDRQTRFVLDTYTFLVLDTHALCAVGDKLFSAGDKHVEKACSNFSHTHTASYQRLPSRTYIELTSENVCFHAGGDPKVMQMHNGVFQDQI